VLAHHANALPQHQALLRMYGDRNVEGGIGNRYARRRRVHNIKTREPPELDFTPEEPRTLNDLISLHINDMGYSLGDLSKMLIMNEGELMKVYSIDLPGHEKGRTAHLRIVR
jgi:hypothetical protein